VPENLGNFEKLLLLAVAHLEEAYGVPIRQEIESRTGRQVSAGAVYTALDRLATRGLVSSEVGPPSPVRGGRRKRVYRLTASGEAALKRSFDELRTMSQGLEARFRLS
jgi:PadR family transcriptional regulator